MRSFLRLMLVLLFHANLLQAQSISDKTIPLDPKVKTGTLPNGLKYFILQNKKPEHKIELRLAVNTGSVQEDNDQQGLAHFMEHMNFNGLQHFPHNELVHYLQSVGVKFGADINAYTSFEETVYMLPIPSTNKDVVEQGFTILADWSNTALLDSDEIEKERGVVLEESRLGKGANDRMSKKYYPFLYNGSIYAKRLPIGKDSILKNFKADVIKRFHKEWYRPNNEAVIVVGDIDVKEAEQLIIEKFSAFTNPVIQKQRGGIITLPARVANKAMVVTDKEASYTAIRIYGNNKRLKDNNTTVDYRARLIQNIFNSLLNKRLDELKNSATPPFVYGAASTGSKIARGWGTYSSYAVCGAKQIKGAVEALVKESMRAKQFGFTANELQRAKDELLAEYESAYNEKDKTESATLVGELVSNFLSHEGLPGIAWEYNFTKKIIPGITLKEVNAVGKGIDIDNRFFALITSKEDSTLPKDADLFKWVTAALKLPVKPYEEKKIATSLLKTPPAAGTIVKEEANAKLGTVTYTLSNGAIVTIKPTDFKNDEIVLTAKRPGGSSLYTGTDYQSAAYSNNVVEEMGYGDFSNTDLEKYLAGKQISVSPVIDDYAELLTAGSNVKGLITMFELLYLKCTSPRKDEIALRSFVNREQQVLEQTLQNPQYAFLENVQQDLYQKHPRAHVIPQLADFDSINIDHAIDFYKQRLGNMNGMRFFIAGNIKPGEIKPLIAKYIGSIAGGNIDTIYHDLKMIPKPGINTFTYKKGKEQKSLLMHYIFDDEKYDVDNAFYMGVLNEVINNKIIDTIREAMGAIYGGGINGGLQRVPHDSYMFTSGFPCGPENVAKVDSAFWNIIKSVKKPGGITTADLDKARKPMIERNKVRVKTNQFWINFLQDAVTNGYSPERVLTYEERINAITPGKLAEIANKFYQRKNVYTAMLFPE